MRLTQFEIDEARKQMVNVDWMREPWEDVVLAALDSYQRVDELFERCQWDYSNDHGQPWVPFSSLRRALYGEE